MSVGAKFKLGQALGLALISCLLSWIAWVTLFSRFADYDDEGYILLSVINVFHGHALYDSVYSQYGPAFYLFTNGLQSLCGELTSNGVRVLALALWVIPSLLLGYGVLRRQGPWAGTFVALSTFCFLHLIQDEPFHPGNLVVLALALALYSESAKPRFSPWVLGGLGAFLFLMKVNVGVFYFLGLFFWLTRGLVSLPLIFLRALLLAAALAVLTRPLLHETWVQLLDLSVLVGAVNLMLTQQSVKLERAVIWRVGLASVLVFLGVLFWALSQGTSPQGLLQGVVLNALQHSVRYSFAIDFRPGTFINLLGAFTFAVLSRTGRLGERQESVLQALFILFVFTCAILLYHTRSLGVVFSYSAPWLWLCCRGSNNRVPSLCAWFLLFQFLHGFPIAGIQIAWGSFLVFTLALLSPPDLSVFSGVSWVRTLRAGGAFLLAVSVLGEAWYRTERYFRFKPIDALGASWIRLEANEADTFSVLTRYCASQPASVFSAPGMFSFNLWSARPTPSLQNTTLWWSLIPAIEQERIRDRLKDALVVCKVSHLDDLRQGITPFSPLHRTILGEMRQQLRTGDYVVFGHMNPAPLGNAVRMLRVGSRVSVRFDIACAKPVTRLDICDYMFGPQQPYFTKRLSKPLSPGQSVDFGSLSYVINPNTSLVSLYGSGDEFLGYLKVVE